MTRECNRVGGINLGQVICDVQPPEGLVRAAGEAIARGPHHYTRPEGLPRLRAAIAAKLRRDNGITADPDREIVVTPGATGGFLAAVQSLLDPGDGLLLFEPYYGYHLNLARVAGLQTHRLRLPSLETPLTESLLRDAVEDDVRALVLCTPANPSGRVLRRSELEAIARVANERDLIVITDEIYEYFVYDDQRHVSPASLPELWPRTVSIFGCSKIFAITGWRIGYAVAPEALCEPVLLANDSFSICAPRPLQEGVAHALEALEPDWYRDRAAEFQSKRDRLCEALHEGGFAPHEPQGAYYVLADVRPLGFTRAREAAMALLEEGGVAAVPGTAFFSGPEGEPFLRVCFAKEDDVLDEACHRIRAFGRRASTGR